MSRNLCFACTSPMQDWVYSCPIGDRFCVSCRIVRICPKGRREIAHRVYPEEDPDYSLRYIERCLSCERRESKIQTGSRTRGLKRTKRVYAIPQTVTMQEVQPLPSIPEEEEEEEIAFMDEEVTEIPLLEPVPLPPFQLPPPLTPKNNLSNQPVRTRQLRSGREF